MTNNSLFDRCRTNTNIESDVFVGIRRKDEYYEVDFPLGYHRSEDEKGLRKVLNFGHTVGHAIESINEGRLLHGECVALGMTVMCSPEVKKRLIPVLKKYDLPTEIKDDMKSLAKLIAHDKKASGSVISTVYVDRVGTFEFREKTAESICGI